MFAREFSFFVVLMIIAISTGYSSLMGGGVQAVATDNVEVVAATDFAMTEKYGHKGGVGGYKIIMANKQVVNGRKYVVTVEVTKLDGACIVQEFSVWNRAGPPGSFLTNSNTMDVACGTIN